MTTKDEIISALNGENDGMAPPAVFTQTATTSQMEACGSVWPDANYDVEGMTNLALQFSKMSGMPIVRIPFDLTAPAEILGCEINKGSNDIQPAVMSSPFDTGELGDVPELISPEEFVESGRCKVTIDAAKKLHDEHPELMVISSSIDPMGLAEYLVGSETYIMATFMDQDGCKKWNDAVSPHMELYAKELSEYSDHYTCIVSGPEDVLQPEAFEDLVSPTTKKMYQALRKGCTSTSHICGVTEHIIDKLIDLGATSLSLETSSDPVGIYEQCHGKVKLVGGIDPIKVLLQGSPQDVVKSAKRYADIGYDVICPECGIPPQTPDENIIALSKYREL